MLSRSSFSIRRLMSQRRPPSPDDEQERHSFGDDETTHLKVHNKQQKTQPWLPARHLTVGRTKRTPKQPIIIRRTQSVHKISSPLPPLPDSPHSSSSSLCSCDCHADAVARGSLPSRRPTLCSPRSRIEGSHPSTRKRPANGTHSHAFAPAPAPISPETETMDAKSDSIDAKLKMYEAFGELTEVHPALREKKPASTDDNSLDGLSENVRQLIRETDQAFEAVGTVIMEAQLPAQALPIPDRPPPPPPVQSAANLGQFRTVLRSEHARAVPSPLASPTRKASVSKVKRKKSKKHRRVEPPRKRKSGPRVSTRWTLGENVAELFSGQLFKRIEADEMLTPYQLEAFKARRESQSEAKVSSETFRSVDSDDSETPVEPFHLQDLPSRIGAAGVRTTLTPIDTMPPWLPTERPIRRDFSVITETSKPKDDDEDATPTQVMQFLSPPLKNPARFLSRPQIPQLSSIPELLVTVPETGATPTATGRRSKTRTFVPVDDEDFVFLSSTPYTLNMSTFKQGPIRFAKMDVIKGMKIAPDDTLDWIAFQMAIQGGAGDLFSDPSDFTQRTDAEEIDDVVDWFEDFGFDNPGLLVSGGEDFEGSPSTAEYSPVSISTTDSELPIPVGPEHPNGFWNEGDFDPTKFFSQGCAIKRWTVEGHPKRYTGASLESLPQSPMFDVVMTTSPVGEMEVVPMGYNLGHDLGDFLRWEAEHVYAAAFWGTD